MAVVTDTFTRGDGNLIGSTSDSGHTWIGQSGAWMVQTNRAVCFAGTGAQATVAIDSGLTSCSLSVDATFPPGSDSGVIFACTNAANHLLLTFETTTLRLWKVSGSGYTSLWGPSSVGSFANSTKAVRVEWDATTGVIEIWFDGTLRTTFTLSSGDRAAFGSATRQGLRDNYVASTLFDNYSVSAPVAPVTTVNATVASGSALMLSPTYAGPSAALSIGAPTATATAQMLAPEVFFGAPTTLYPNSLEATADFPTPSVYAPVYEAEAPPARASATMLAPVRLGAVAPSVYKQMVDRISPAATLIYHFDDDTGLPVIVGDDEGHSRVFDGINDFTSIAGPGDIGHMTFILWFQEDEGVIGERGLFTDLGGEWSLSISAGGRVHWKHSTTASGSVLVSMPPPPISTLNSIGGPVVRDGQRHMVMLTYEDRSQVSFPGTASPLVRMFVDGVKVGEAQSGLRLDLLTAELGALQSGGFPGTQYAYFKGRIDEFAVFQAAVMEYAPGSAVALQDEWALELWWQGTGVGGPPTSVTAPIATTSGRAPAPSLAIRPVLDSWQIHEDFSELELDPELWVVGYQPQFLMPEGPNGPAPADLPLDEVPFISGDMPEMILRSGTMISTRDWFSFGEWVARIEMEPIPGNSDVVVSIGLFAAFPQDGDWWGYFGPNPSDGKVAGMPFTNRYEDQFVWWTYPLGSRRYLARVWGVFSPGYDDAAGMELVPYDPDAHDIAIITSPHSRGGQNVTDYLTGSTAPGGGIGDGHMPYWPMEGPHNNPYEARLLRLVIQVTGPPGESITILGINLTEDTNKIVIPTGVLQGDVGAIMAHTYPRPYEGVRGPRSLKPPVIRTTGRFPVPPRGPVINAEVMQTVADFRFPEWAGDARPATQFPGVPKAFAIFIPPVLYGEPVDIVIEVPIATSSGRAWPPVTSGTIRLEYGIARSETRKMQIKIEHTKMELGIGIRELVGV